MNARLRAMLTLLSNPRYSLLLYGKPCSEASVHQAKVVRTLFERSPKIHLSLWVSPSSHITWAFLCHMNQLLVHKEKHETWHCLSFPNCFFNPVRYLQKQLLGRCSCSTCAQQEPRWVAHTHHTTGSFSDAQWPSLCTLLCDCPVPWMHRSQACRCSKTGLVVAGWSLPKSKGFYMNLGIYLSLKQGIARAVWQLRVLSVTRSKISWKAAFWRWCWPLLQLVWIKQTIFYTTFFLSKLSYLLT